jgi:hypothetical protein
MTAIPEPRALMSPLPLEALKLIDAVCTRFEAALKGGTEPALEHYLEAAPKLLRIHLFRELLQSEQELRATWGEPVQAEVLRARFPEYAAIIDAVRECAGDTDPAPFLVPLEKNRRRGARPKDFYSLPE